MRDPIIPFYPHKNIFAHRASDCLIYDEEGNKFVDLDSGVWCVNAGHCHPVIADAIAKQSSDIVHHGYSFRNRQADQLAEELLAKLNFAGGASVFLSSGSEAVNLAITMAERLTGRNKILVIKNAYLSAFGHAQQAQANEKLFILEDGDEARLDKMDLSSVAAFVFEPGTAWGRVIFPEGSFVTLLANKIRDAGGMVIVDEVTTGFGRTGRWFGYMHYDIEPDIIVTGKAMGNGYPVSAVSVSEKIKEQFSKSIFRYAQSHQNDPLGCAVGLAVFKVFEEQGLVERSKSSGDYFLKELLSIQKDQGSAIKAIRGRGLMIAIELENERDSKEVHQKLFDHGYILGQKENVLRFMPPLTIKQAVIKEFVDLIKMML